MPTLNLPRRRRHRTIRIPVYTVQVHPHPTLGHTLTWSPQRHDVDPDERISLTESGRQLAAALRAQRQTEEAEQ